MNMKYLLCILLLNTIHVYSKPINPLDLLNYTVTNNKCCIDHENKPSFPLEIVNYDCSQLNDFGKNRCL